MTSVARSNQEWRAGQAHPDVVLIGDPDLRRPITPITDFEAAKPVFDRLVSLLQELNGAGLAAPQIGHSVAAIVVEVRKTDLFPDRPESPLYQMANPRVITSSEHTEPGWEGCFSVPGLMGIVYRPREIEVAYHDQDGTNVRATFEGYLARVIQHEIDHLNGLVFLDRMTSMQSLTTTENYARFHASGLATSTA